MPLSLHAGWLSMAAFLNTAQVIVAYRLAPVDALLGHLPQLAFDAVQTRSFTHGQSAAGIEGVVGAMYRAYDGTRFLGVGTLSEGGLLVPTRLMATGNQ